VNGTVAMAALDLTMLENIEIQTPLFSTTAIELSFTHLEYACRVALSS
jgi:hypothetical protein